VYSYINLVEYFVDCFVDYFEYFSYVVHTSLEYTHSLRNTVYLPRNTLYPWLSYMMSYSHYSYSCPPSPLLPPPCLPTLAMNGAPGLGHGSTVSIGFYASFMSWLEMNEENYIIL
jgi:hypothetical protein